MIITVGCIEVEEMGQVGKEKKGERNDRHQKAGGKGAKSCGHHGVRLEETFSEKLLGKDWWHLSPSKSSIPQSDWSSTSFTVVIG